MKAGRLEIDVVGGVLGWHHRGDRIAVAVAGLADAAVEPASGRIVALTRADGGRLLLFEPDGAAAGSIDAPAGYTLSHFVAGPDGLAVVGQGEVPEGGWPDWHFLIDVGASRLRRAGPAY